MAISEEHLTLLMDFLESTDETDSDTSDSESSIEHHEKITNFIETIERFTDSDFQKHFRLKRTTAQFLIDSYKTSKYVPSVTHGKRARIGYTKEIYIYLWYVSNTVTFRQLATLFGVVKYSAWISVKRVAHWLISISHQFIVWPNAEKTQQQNQKFESKNGIPGVMGAIDCTHITIKAPTNNKESYFDRKRNYSIVLQAIVDADKKFISIFCGEPGSMHDSRVLRRSKIYAKIFQNQNTMMPDNTFILGDSGYPSLSWLVPPFKDFGNQTQMQKIFNYKHSSTRIVVENTFGLLKTRFRRLLHFMEQSKIPSVVNIITSICVLHNICVTMDDDYILDEYDDNPTDPAHGNSVENSNEIDRRQILFNYMQQNNLLSR